MAIREWHGGQLVIFWISLVLLELFLFFLFKIYPQIYPLPHDPVSEYITNYGPVISRIRWMPDALLARS